LKLARTKEWRESHGLTQRELAAEAGVGEVTVARIETGASVTPPTARKIAEALGVSVADLLERPPVPLAVITFPPGAVEEVLAAHRAGKLSKRGAQKAIADLARSGPGDPLDNAAELLLDYAESKRAQDREGAEA
jgi:transcriptional regulator with XRE-family HTH domain